jgi:hypothetical protein
MKRIHFALAAAMLCAATVSACKKDEPPAPAVEPAAVEPAAVEPAMPPAEPAPVESTGMAADASVGMAMPSSVETPAATEDDDTPHSGGDKVGGG